MKFEWDENKRKLNLTKHGIDFKDAHQIFNGITFTFEDDRFDYGEERYITIGMLRGTVVIVAHTENDDVIRLISSRKATKHEQKLYYQGFRN